MTRATFQAAIEAGIEEAGLTPAQAEPLRAVGRTAERSVAGAYERDGCECPITAAGLGRPASHPTSLAIHLGFRPGDLFAFIHRYDQDIGRVLARSLEPRPFTITDDA